MWAFYVHLVGVVAALANVVFWFAAARKLLPALARARAIEPREGNSTSRAEPVSVVVAVRDGARLLPPLLDALLAQRYPDFEVVVCDDVSTDDTWAVLQAYSARDGRLRATRLSTKAAPGKKRALARAIAHARHDWLLATDADCRPDSPHWLAATMASRRANTQLVLGYSPYRRVPGRLNAWIRWEAVYTAAQYFSAALWGRPYMGVGRNLLYARGLYDGVGGFTQHEHLAGGDDDLLVSAAADADNCACSLTPASWVTSEPATSWAQYRRQKRRHVSVGHAYRAGDKLWLGALALTHVILYASAVALCVLGYWAAGVVALVVRWGLLWWPVRSLLRALGQPDLARWWPLLDAGLAVYYVAFAAPAVLPKGHSDTW